MNKTRRSCYLRRTNRKTKQCETKWEMLNDLLQINNDRIVGYQKAIDELKPEDSDLKVLFTRYISQSRENATELTTEITRLDGKPTDGTTNSGKIYRVWMDLKAAIAGKDRKTK